MLSWGSSPPDENLIRAQRRWPVQKPKMHSRNTVSREEWRGFSSPLSSASTYYSQVPHPDWHLQKVFKVWKMTVENLASAGNDHGCCQCDSRPALSIALSEIRLSSRSVLPHAEATGDHGALGNVSSGSKELSCKFCLV